MTARATTPTAPPTVGPGALPPVTEGGATIRVRITDLQGRLNLNALAGDESRRERTTAILERLITAADPEADAAGVTAAAVDWIDDDLQPAFPGGAEDDYYTRREPPYRSANAPMAEVSELRLVRGVTDEVMEGLSGYITALPPEASGINLNTAPPGLLERLHPGVSADDIRALTAARDEEPLTSVDEALRLAPTLAQPEIPRGWYRVDSEYFRVTAIVTLDRIEQRWQSILQRPPTGAIPVLARRPVLP
ncbi:MAG: type II secretion system minor pseudopilin GspK [Arhodomonas sp.]|nr:type II secretion system minor pseudopilin GspK [Arhodomonas sp.]